MSQDVVIVLDCGATNIRAIAIAPDGRVVAKALTPNASLPAAENPDWQIWSLDKIMDGFGRCARRLTTELSSCRVRGLAVTTFGVDGALVDPQGGLLYPVISWKCPRTALVMADIARYIAPAELQGISGIGQFSFNTLYKLIWLKQHHPALLAKARAWLFISSLINHRLTGAFTTDRTMAGTSQLLDVRRERFSERILGAIGLDAALFPPLVNAGDTIGALLPAAAAMLGLPAGLPVIAAGHDTQFALFGSGAELNQPVLSSGTWEILMVRTRRVDTGLLPDIAGSTCELDSCAGLFNPGLQWLASGVLEWVRELCWPATPPGEVYRDMMREAREVPPGADGVRMRGSLLASGSGLASWHGLSLTARRGHIYRAALEGLAVTLRDNLALLQQIGGFTVSELTLVGGGGRNALWNQIKADLLNMPIKVMNEAETTVLGASMFIWSGVGYFPSPGHARGQVAYQYQWFRPGGDYAGVQLAPPPGPLSPQPGDRLC
ncbi:L-fuculokinase [Acerihabitans arboris]|uniref:L-fuculokinase n=1 Tax=Acerihabitans arboris TaxID=2691583 RepID=A0A845SFU3_9GAMM|nr:L-fuculokinase [Acerihabitans arboris]NDL61578.1 L-fuculokinase [Acerihabitans arboris]